MVNQELNQYKTIIFDCDGVVLNSNKIKTNAFYEVAKHFGHGAAKKLVDYHVRNGGISRYAKFQYFFKELIKHEVDINLYDDTLLIFSNIVKNNLMTCEVAKGKDSLRMRTSQAK
jgi:phosphoglycolate phosphatase-like HAD superfamily hydrolase